MIIGINLLWWKWGKIGGGESFVKNLLYGFDKFADNDIQFKLFIPINIEDNIKKLGLSDKFKLKIIPINSEKTFKTILFQMFNLSKILKKENVDIIYHPTPHFPLLRSNIKSVVTIHDLQFFHYPEYASYFQRKKYELSIEYFVKNSNKIVAVSNFVKQDILNHFKNIKNDIKVIYNPITGLDSFGDFNLISTKYNINKKEYFYTISSMLPHKNLETLIYLMKEIKNKNYDFPNKLVISGVGGKDKIKIENLIHHLGINDSIVITGYIEDKIRNTLYKNAFMFLFPSIFEGFGMPPVEAMILGTPVVTTKQPAIYEVTQGKAFYVDNPYDVKEWINKIYEAQKLKNGFDFLFEEYSLESVTKKYLKIFKKLI